MEEGRANQPTELGLRSAHPLGGAGHRDDSYSTLLCPVNSEIAVGLWPFLSYCFCFVPICTCVQLFLVPYSFFVFFTLADVCPDTSTAAKGPRPQRAGQWVPVWSCSGRMEPVRPLEIPHNSLGGGCIACLRVGAHVLEEAPSKPEGK